MDCSLEEQLMLNISANIAAEHTLEDEELVIGVNKEDFLTKEESNKHGT